MTESEDNVPPKEGGSKRKCILLMTVLLACVAIVAIVLPFYLDYPPGPGKKSGEETSPGDTKPGITTKPETGSPTISPTNAPSDAPTTLQWGQFLQAFLIPISGEEVFMDKNSPQYRAAKYLLDDPYTAEIPTTGRLTDRYASATFYFATEGENLKSCYFGDTNCDSGQWLVDDVCYWYAVSCDNDGHVVSFLFANAEGNGLVGTLPPEMRLLTFMADLVIVNNSIKGTLPEAFGESARSMRSLLLPDNDLTGQIPDNYLVNSPLEYVHLANNAFSGTIPTGLGMTTTLQQLDLSGNLMTGTISEAIGGYESLEALSLANNELKGNIPEEIYAMTDLKFLHMNGNDFSGTISKSIRDLSLLKELRVGGSGLSGQLPDELYTLTDLVELDISQSSFDGRLSLGFLNLEGLEKLNVAENKLIGTVPSSFGQLSGLSDLNLQGNEFSGAIPESVCLLRNENLEVLTADCNKLACDCCSTCL
jgi:Leucine-rich repeat (LRR) protein